MVVRPEHRQIVRDDDPVPGDRVDERAVRHRERDVIAFAQGVDVRERREVRRAVAGDVDELALAGHEGA